MKIIKKRVLASLIDAFIFGAIVASIQLLIPNLLVNRGLLLIFLFIPFFSRDFVFRNASIGKKLLGIAIYDNDWRRPRLEVLLKRSFLTATVGYYLLFKAKFTGGNILAIIDFEREKIGTRVIDKKVYKELEIIAKAKKGEYKSNINELYNEYLRNLYLK